jgi:glucose/arabinose dehydrogenase
MKATFFSGIILTIVFLIACSGNHRSVENSYPAKNGNDSLAPVETQSPNTGYKPAFKGQTRVAGVKTKAAFKVDKIAEKLVSPWAIIPLPDGRLLLT